MTLSTDYGPWSPASLAEIRDLLDSAPFRWWVAGGHALELHVGHAWRDHADTDVGSSRADAQSVHQWLHHFDLNIAANGRLKPWDGRPLIEADAENNVWVRRELASPWWFDMIIGDGDDANWIYRRNRSVRRPWDQAVLTGSDGTPYLAPEIQLLFKSKGLRPKDQADAEVVIPVLDADRQKWLKDHLPLEHPWTTI